MTKIIFEQIGNIITTILLLLSLNELLPDKSSHSGIIFINIGFYTFLFIIWLILFLFLRILYSYWDKNYELKRGEYSASDEREINISQRSSTIAYKCCISYLIIATVIYLFINNIYSISEGITLLLILGSIIILSFFTYLLAWIYFYLKT
ncbi:hypothetical protein [Staphylococcus epidermidis]|uniref:hypothetical protein n=1 Tax=Staphylococcus TaxID=1279 RepID=UPI00094A8DD5|nr:hypothetical protein [Staphylococcus epidermidis]APT17796.1 hypothetical protein BUM85_13150 [Staphylococcus epidermidis]MDS3930001.1 hypothetical protein [Staphylococcus epidermidis]